MPNPWVSLRCDQLIPVNKAVNKKEQLVKKDGGGGEKEMLYLGKEKSGNPGRETFANSTTKKCLVIPFRKCSKIRDNTKDAPSAGLLSLLKLSEVTVVNVKYELDSFAAMLQKNSKPKF
jgi:hypothetical protein